MSLLLAEVHRQKHLEPPLDCLAQKPSWGSTCCVPSRGGKLAHPQQTATLLMAVGQWTPEPGLCLFLTCWGPSFWGTFSWGKWGSF